METIGAKIHAAMGSADHFVYTNEGCHDNGPVGWKSIPPSLDVISIDGYHAGRNESDSIRAIYEKGIFPKLLPHQRVAVVPFLGGCACGTAIPDALCEVQSPSATCTYNDSDVKRCSCSLNGEDISLEGQERLLLEKLDAYWSWAQADKRVAGIVPWVSRRRRLPPSFSAPLTLACPLAALGDADAAPAVRVPGAGRVRPGRLELPAAGGAAAAGRLGERLADGARLRAPDLRAGAARAAGANGRPFLYTGVLLFSFGYMIYIFIT